MNKKELIVLKEFDELKPALKKWGEMIDSILVDSILNDMVEDNQIKIFPEFRLKDDKSYLFKALYRKKNYHSPIVDIEDKIGTRLVVLKSDDIQVIQDRILNYPDWTAKLTKDINQEIEDKPNIFDYQSCHIVVKPNKGEEKFHDGIIPSLSCEIQIRTLLQHAFAEVSHDSTYKGPYKNDKKILRGLAKSMALMEATDDYFCDIFELMNDEKRFYAQFLNELINLYKTFNSDFDKKTLNLFITDSIFDLLELNIITIQDLDGFIIKYKEDLSKYILAKNGLLFQQPTIILVLYYFYNHRSFLKQNWPLNNETLKTIYKITGTSFDNY